MAMGSPQPLTEISTMNISLEVKMADFLTTIMCRLSRNLESSTLWNPQSFSRPVQGLLELVHSNSIFMSVLDTYVYVSIW